MRENETVGKTKKDVAILIPIHPPYFKYADAIFKSWHKTALDVQSDLWFVFTNESERDRFVAWENCIVLPPELRNFENHGIITIKKFYGLSKIKDEYEYVIIFDAECRFLKNVDLKAVCNTYWNNKVLLGNAQFKKEISISIKQGCKRFFVSNSNIAELDDDDLYLWFNQPCIYKCNTVDDFFEKIDYAKNAASFSFSEFDYYIYMYYLLMFCGFKIVDMEIRASWGALESASKRILKSENTRGGGLVFYSDKYKSLSIWVCSRVVLKIFDNPNLFAIFQLDKDSPMRKISALRHIPRKLVRKVLKLLIGESRYQWLKSKLKRGKPV